MPAAHPQGPTTEGARQALYEILGDLAEVMRSVKAWRPMDVTENGPS
jgi:hypothetical protein